MALGVEWESDEIHRSYWECRKGSSEKFWEIQIVRLTALLEDGEFQTFKAIRRWGRIGMKVRQLEDDFESEVAALDFARTQVQRRIDKSYTPISAKGAVAGLRFDTSIEMLVVDDPKRDVGLKPAPEKFDFASQFQAFVEGGSE